jgi:hypothetical protein
MTSAAKWAISSARWNPGLLLSASANSFSIRAFNSLGFEACITASRISSGSSGIIASSTLGLGHQVINRLLALPNRAGIAGGEG